MKITYRGYQGHFICKCNFHLNTLINYENKDKPNIIVSTIGQYIVDGKMQELGCNKNSFFETMVFNTQMDKVKIKNKLVEFEDIIPSELKCERTDNEVSAQKTHDETVLKYTT